MRLVSLIGAPEDTWREVRPIVVTVVTPVSVLGRDASVDLQAQGFDAAGQLIPDLMFEWSVRPGPGNGTLSWNRDGSRATLTNVLTRPLGPPLYTGHQVQVEARAIYCGQLREGVCDPIPLQP